MNVFISWSGEPSRTIAEQFRQWLPNVLQYVKPYFTPTDIDKGAKWQSEISKKLEESAIGIIIATKSNIQKPWINFEAGALSKSIERSRVCTVLFGVENTDLTGPLALFQSTNFNEDEFRKLLLDINRANADNKLDDDIVKKSFEKWWPDLQEAVSDIMVEKKEKLPSQAKARPDRELLEEILSIARSLRIAQADTDARQSDAWKSAVQNFLNHRSSEHAESRILDKWQNLSYLKLITEEDAARREKLRTILAGLSEDSAPKDDPKSS